MSAPSVPGPELLALQQAVAGRYSLVRELGRGGMGIVFLARDLALDRLVAIKLLPPTIGGSPPAREAFLREARTAAALAHPHIVAIHLVESRGDLTYFVMAYVEGETLGARIRRAGALPADDTMRVVQEVAWALAHAHANGIVHRDVKPDNVLLDRASGRAMVTDFGIARRDTHDRHDTPADGAVRGTPQFVSPEVVQGGRGDARSDLYSLGVTAWMAAAGRPPFEGASAAALVLAHVHAAPPSLAAHARVPERFARAVDRCLAKDPADRWPTADAFAAEIDAARARGPGVAAPVRAFLREWESVTTEVGTAATAAGVAAAEMIGIPLHSWLTLGRVSFDAEILSAIFAVLTVLTAGLAKARLLQLVGKARGMLRAGYGHARIAAAQAADDAAREDERQAAQLVDRAQRREMLGVLGGTVVGTVGAFALAFSDAGAWFNVIGAAGAVALPTLAIRTAMQLDLQASAEPLASRLLRGWLGRWVFRAGGVRIGTVPTTAALEGPEPTALALGQAARELYLGLPAGTRDAIAPDLLELITVLERRALHARAGAEGGRLDAITALEAIRLDLLRVSVHQLSPNELTAELVKVRAMGDAVDRRLEAARDVDALLAARDLTPAERPPLSTPSPRTPRP
jgi:hypothetical protein